MPDPTNHRLLHPRNTNGGDHPGAAATAGGHTAPMDPHPHTDRRQRGPLWPAVAWLVVIALVTLVPRGGGGSTTSDICIFCGHRGLADFVLNVGLFIPLGAALALRGVRFGTAAAAGLLLTLGIELAQMTVIDGRDANVGDVLANGTGAVLGWCLWARGLPFIRRTRGGGSWPALVAGGLVMTLLLGALQLFRPAFTDATYYTQWAAEFGNMGRFTGEVRASRIGPLSLDGPPWRIERSDSVRRLLERGATIEVDIVGDTVPWGPAPIFSIYDDHQREILMLAQYDRDLAFRYRLLASRLRFDSPDLRGWGVLAGVDRPGTVRLVVRRDGRTWCIGAGNAVRCDLGFTPGDTWMLLYAPDWLDAPLRAAVSMAWLMALFVPVGAFVGRRRTAALVATLAVAGLIAGPWATGFMITPVRELFAAVLGILLGARVDPTRMHNRPRGAWPGGG